MAGQTDFYNVKFDGLLQIAGIPVGYNELYHMPISRPYVFDLLQKYHRLCVQFRCFTGRVKLCLPNCAATGCVIGGTASMLGTPGLCPAKKSCGVARQACLTCHGNSIILFPDHYYTVPGSLLYCSYNSIILFFRANKGLWEFTQTLTRIRLSVPARLCFSVTSSGTVRRVHRHAPFP